jgi:hypothetical protein
MSNTLLVRRGNQHSLVISARAVIYRERVEIGAQVVEFPQVTPSMVWTVLHNLGRKPGVQVVVGGEVVLAEVAFLDLNTVQVRFAAPQTGSTLII